MFSSIMEGKFRNVLVAVRTGMNFCVSIISTVEEMSIDERLVKEDREHICGFGRTITLKDLGFSV